VPGPRATAVAGVSGPYAAAGAGGWLRSPAVTGWRLDGTAGGGDRRADRTGPGVGTGPADGAERWLAGLRADTGADQRRRASWLSRQAEEEATLLGVLADLAERGRPAVVDVAGGRRHRGVVGIVGEDFVGLRTEGGTPVLVARAAITGVRPAPGDTGAVGDRRLAPQVTLAGVLSSIAGSGARLVLVPFGGGEPIAGELRSVGTDVMALRLDADGGSVHVPLAAVAEVQLAVSG